MAAEHAWRGVEIIVNQLEAKLARVTGKEPDWRFDYLRVYLDAIKGVQGSISAEVASRPAGDAGSSPATSTDIFDHELCRPGDPSCSRS